MKNGYGDEYDMDMVMDKIWLVITYNPDVFNIL
jgi:hypothetical protein